MKLFIETLSVLLGLLGTYMLSKKHYSAPLILVGSYSLFFVFNIWNAHWVSTVGIVIKILLSLKTAHMWRTGHKDTVYQE